MKVCVVEKSAGWRRLTRFTAPFNLTGLPIGL
jgi:hypothetical protein